MFANEFNKLLLVLLNTNQIISEIIPYHFKNSFKIQI